MKNQINRVLLLGDSLSDRGTMNQRRLFGIIPMSMLAGLSKNSPQGRFTNGLVWSDHLASKLASRAIIDEHLSSYSYLNSRASANAELADDVISGRGGIAQSLDCYSLSNDKSVKYRGQDLMSSYVEGGLTSANYRFLPSLNPERFFSRLVLATLKQKREALINQDKRLGLSDEQLEKSLIVEWSGANDLITVNKRPSKALADKAIAQRIENIEKLIEHGYHHFVLFNLPDLSLTPRYKGEEVNASERKNARKISDYFNAELQVKLDDLSARYPKATINVFDVNHAFVDAYQNPQKYGLDKSKHLDSITEQFDGKPQGAEGYLFWDDVHPSADMHAILADKFYQHIEQNYDIVFPQSEKTLTACAPAA